MLYSRAAAQPETEEMTNHDTSRENRWYLRIEGVNFDHFVLDSNELKIIRGGSLLLLNSVDFLAHKMPELDKITAGASWGLFAFEAKNRHESDRILRRARRFFDRDPRYRHATITLAVLPANDEYQRTRGRLATLSRWQQMQSPSLAVPLPGSRSRASGICQVDKVRPANRHIRRRRDNPRETWTDVSASVKARWTAQGREKRRFYQQRTGLNLTFTDNLHDLAAPADGQDFGNLNHKMAVIYLDGNNFGKLAGAYCRNEEKQREFDRRLRVEFQNGALKTLLEEIHKDPDFENCGKIRLETLLWGGDEIIWVVPAWKGWWLLGRFFEITRDWKLDKLDEKPLTHGAGLVFCHSNAPIRPVIELVKLLGDAAKGDRSANRVAYQILESFDHTGADPETVRRRRWPLDDTSSMILGGDAMLEAEQAVRHIKANDLPKRRLYRLAHLAFSDHGKARAIAGELKPLAGEQNLIDLERCFGSGLATWLHLLELWEYLGLEKGGNTP